MGGLEAKSFDGVIEGGDGFYYGGKRIINGRERALPVVHALMRGG